MDVILKSELSTCEVDGDWRESVNVLVVYEDVGFVTTLMELLREAAGGVRGTGPVFCAIWDFDFLADPLLLRIAGREVSSADLVIFAVRAWAEQGGSIQNWLRVWLWTPELLT